MILWIDAQLSPAIAAWITESFSGVRAKALRDLGLRDAEDDDIFAAAKRQNAIVVTKDRDFIELLERLGPPPAIIWLTCGNTSNAKLKHVLGTELEPALVLISHGEPLVEITG